MGTAFGASTAAQQRENQRLERERERAEKERLEREEQNQLTEEQREEIKEAVWYSRTDRERKMADGMLATLVPTLRPRQRPKDRLPRVQSRHEGPRLRRL